MNIEEIREYCINKADTEESFPFGPNALVFKVDGKMYMLLSIDEQPARFNVKCDPEKAEALREAYSCVIPGYHMNKKHWNTVIVDGTATSQELKGWIDDSYNLVRKKKKGV